MVPNTVIPPNVDTIKIHFSEPMHISHGMLEINDINIQTPEATVEPAWKDIYRSVFIIVLDKSKMINNKTYGFKLNHKAFQSAKTYPMKEAYTYTFKIGE